MVIYNQALVQLICTEAERAIAASNEYLELTQQSGAIRHRRRAIIK